jgi:hypothetical protein
VPLSDHAVLPGVHAGHGGALGGVSVAEAAASDHQLVQGVVVLLQHVGPAVQQVVPQRVQLGQVDPQVGDAQELWEGGREATWA